jgi:hypothetical protein
MKLTKKTIMVWQDEFSKKQPPELEFERLEWIRQKVLENKTDGVAVQKSSTHVERYWVDQNAAEEWQNYLLDAVKKYNAKLASITIEDN